MPHTESSLLVHTSVLRRHGLVLRIAIAAIAVAVLSCSVSPSYSQDTSSDLAASALLLNLLESSYEADEISVAVEEPESLTVAIVNSAFNELGPRELKRTAREIAMFSYSNWSGDSPLVTVVVRFIHRDQGAGAQMDYTFQASELQE